MRASRNTSRCAPHFTGVPQPQPKPNQLRGGASAPHLRLAHDPIPALIPDSEHHPVSVPVPYVVAVPRIPAAPPDAIPPPRPEMLGRVALQAYEVIEGTRSLAQLGNLISFELSLQLAEVRAARQEQQQVTQDFRYATAQCGRIHVCPVIDGVVEAAVVLHTSRRSHAVAIRLEWAHQRWRASYLAVL